MQFDVTAIGELLIDFTPEKVDGEPGFFPKPGGGPANVAAAVRKLGGVSAFMGKVGNDQFGEFLKNALDRVNVDTSGLVMDGTAPTTLAFVHLDDCGDRSFSFYRKNCADIMLRRDELNLSLIEQSKILHFGAVSLTDDPSKDAVLFAAEYARKKGILVSYDPNYRPSLWRNEEVAVATMREGLRLADIVKVSGEEMELITGERDLAAGTKALSECGARLVIVTLGADGAFFRYGDYTSNVPTVDVHVVDTNGAGDAFFGGLLYQLTRSKSPMGLSEEQILGALRFANAVGALTTTAHGAIPAIPTLPAVLDVL